MTKANNFRWFKTIVLMSESSELPDNKPVFGSFVKNKKILRQIVRKYFVDTIQKEVELSGGNIFNDIETLVTITELVKSLKGFMVAHIQARDLPEIIKHQEILQRLKANDLLGFVVIFDGKALEQINETIFNEVFSLMVPHNFKIFNRYNLNEKATFSELENIKRYLSYFNESLFTEVQFERPEVYHHPEISDATMPNQGIFSCHACKERLHLVLKANGEVYPCSVGSLTPQLCIGNWINEDMEEILDRFINNNTVIDLIDNGPLSLINPDDENLAEKALNRPYLDSCHGCRILFTEVLDKKQLVEAYD